MLFFGMAVASFLYAKKRPAGVGSPVGLLPSVVIWFSSGQPLGIVTALPVCPAVFCRI
jgi:hypothetical protein